MFKSYNEDKEYDRRFDLETMRMQTMILVNINLKPHQQIKDPKRFLKFYWEELKAEDVEIWTEDEWDVMDEKLKLKK